jgi:hypothetical protein
MRAQCLQGSVIEKNGGSLLKRDRRLKEEIKKCLKYKKKMQRNKQNFE